MRRRIIKQDVKAQGSTQELHLKLVIWNLVEDSRISSVEVKFVDIGKNTSGEGDYLGHF